jgi:hypothetical protein
VSESSFQNPDGTPVSKLKSYMDIMWLLERDEEGNLPQVGEFKGSDPSTYTKLMDEYRLEMSVNMGVPPSMMGIHADGNPASADAIRAGYEDLTQRVFAKQQVLGEGWEQTMRLALLIRDGEVSPQAARIETDWRDPAPSTPAGTSDAITKQITVGAIPAASDVTLKRLGYSAVERARLAQDRELDQGQSFLNQIAHSLEAKDARVDKSLSNDLSAPSTGANPGKQPVPTPQDVFGGKKSGA